VKTRLTEARWLLSHAAVVGMLAFCGALSHAASPAKHDPVAATRAMRALLAVANAEIPKKSSCYAFYGQRGTFTVKDVLAPQLANLTDGKNAIAAGCARKQCRVEISHEHGESVAMAILQFTVHKEKAVVSSLVCDITP
jgi:hypothetical protein